MAEEKKKPFKIIKDVEDPTGKKVDVPVYGDSYTCVKTEYRLKCTPIDQGFGPQGAYVKKPSESIIIRFMEEYWPEVDIVQRGLRIKPEALRFMLDKKVNRTPILIYFKDRPRSKETKKLEDQVEVLKTQKSELQEQMTAMAEELKKLKEEKQKGKSIGSDNPANQPKKDS